MTYVSMQKYEDASESSRRDSIQFMLLQNVGQIHAQIFFFFFAPNPVHLPRVFWRTPVGNFLLG